MNKAKKITSLALSATMLLSLSVGLNLSVYADDAKAVSLDTNYIIETGESDYAFTAPQDGTYGVSGAVVDCLTPNDGIYVDFDLDRDGDGNIWGDNDVCESASATGKSKLSDTTFDLKEGETIKISCGYWRNYGYRVNPSKVSFSISKTTAVDAHETWEHYNEATGLYYLFDVDDKTATVLGPTSERYYYDIPSTIDYTSYDDETLTFTVTAIDDYAFNSCYNLERVSIPSTVTSIGNGVFSNCPNLSEVNVDGNASYKVADGYLLSADGKQLLWHRINDNKSSVTIPDGVERINYGAFQGYSTLTSVSMPSSVVYIGDKAFMDCNLKNVTLSENTEFIGKSAFENNSKLRTITIPASTVAVDERAFANCSKLINVDVKSTNVAFGEDVFTGCPADMIMFVLDDSTAQTYAQSENIYTNKTAPDYLVKANCVHSYTVAFSTPATCTSNGCTVYTCPKCNETYVTIEQAKGHTIVTDKAIAATYYATGKTQGSHCSVCGAVIVAQKTVAKLTLATPAITLTAQSKGFKVAYKKITGATGYEIQYSTSSKFTSAKSVKVTSLSKSITKLTAKKKYYVRVRAYHTESGKGTVYSSWSSAKNVTTK